MHLQLQVLCYGARESRAQDGEIYTVVRFVTAGLGVYHMRKNSSF